MYCQNTLQSLLLIVALASSGQTVPVLQLVSQIAGVNTRGPNTQPHLPNTDFPLVRHESLPALTAERWVPSLPSRQWSLDTSNGAVSTVSRYNWQSQNRNPPWPTHEGGDRHYLSVPDLATGSERPSMDAQQMPNSDTEEELSYYADSSSDESDSDQESTSRRTSRRRSRSNHGIILPRETDEPKNGYLIAGRRAGGANI